MMLPYLPILVSKCISETELRANSLTALAIDHFPCQKLTPKILKIGGWRDFKSKKKKNPSKVRKKNIAYSFNF